MEILKYIRLGIQAKEIFFYDDLNITIRPLTSSEMDDVEYMSMKDMNSKLAKMIMKIRLGSLNLSDEFDDLNPEMYLTMQNFYREMDYWTTFHAMKDFMPEDFSIEDVRKMRYVHEIAKKAFDISSATDTYIMDVVSTVEGQELVEVIYKYKVPLADAAWKLTPLQHKFYKFSSSDAPVKIANSLEELDEMFNTDIGVLTDLAENN